MDDKLSSLICLINSLTPLYFQTNATECMHACYRNSVKNKYFNFDGIDCSCGTTCVSFVGNSGSTSYAFNGGTCLNAATVVPTLSQSTTLSATPSPLTTRYALEDEPELCHMGYECSSLEADAGFHVRRH